MKRSFLLKCALGAFLGLAQNIYSGGFALIEQSVSYMGTAYSGTAAAAWDSSTVFFNPAGMSKLCRQEVIAGVHAVFPIAEFDNDDSKIILGPDLTGGDGGNAGRHAAVPHTYYVRPLNCYGMAIGLGINSPFGLVTDYKSTWVGRYHARRSDLLTININPSISFCVNDCFSVGAGFDAMYLDATVTNSIDFGTILFLMNEGGIPQGQDGKARLDGDSWGYGANVGFLWDLSSCTRIGVHYRSEIKHDVKGKVKFKDVPEQGDLQEVFFNADATSEVTLPSSLIFSIYHEINPCWAVMADVQWTKWKVLKSLKFILDNLIPPEQTTTLLKWDNAMRYSIGATYTPWDCLVLRSGVCYDGTPIPDKLHRTPRIPGEDRVWIAVGAGYRWNECLAIDFGYAHLFVRTPRIDKSSFDLDEDILRGGLKGDWDAKTDIVSVQVKYYF